MPHLRPLQSKAHSALSVGGEVPGYPGLATGAFPKSPYEKHSATPHHLNSDTQTTENGITFYRYPPKSLPE